MVPAGPPLHALVAHGAVTLAASAVLQRVLTFAANSLAARIAGPAVFGAYSAAVSTCGLAAGCAGLGVGTVTSCHIGRFPRDSVAYARLVRLLAAMTAVAACAGTAALLVGAEVVADWGFRNGALAPVLRTAGLLSGALILYESLSGVAVGLLSFRMLLTLTAVLGLAMLLALTSGASLGPRAMVAGHAAALVLAVALTGVLHWRAFRPLPAGADEADVAAPRASELLSLGATQVVSNAGVSLASWVLLASVVRYDPALAQAGYYAVGNQLRGLVAVAPGLLAQVVFPLLNRLEGVSGGQSRLVGVLTSLSAGSSAAAGCLLISALPLALAFYGPAYAQAMPAAALLVLAGVVHMGGSPLAQYLMAVDLRATALINMAWAGGVVLLGLWLAPIHGAAGAALAWLTAHLGAQVAVQAVLHHRGLLPRGSAAAWSAAVAGSAVVAALGWAAYANPSLWPAALAVQVVLLLLVLAALVRIAASSGTWVPGIVVTVLRRGTARVQAWRAGAMDPWLW